MYSLSLPQHAFTNVCQAHQGPVYASDRTITYQHFKLWSSLDHLLTQFILVRVACGSNIRKRHHSPHHHMPRKASNYVWSSLNHLLTHVILVRVACGSRITPEPYEKAQASDEICKRAAHLGSKLNQKNVVVGRVCACACVHVWMHGCIRSRDECTQASKQSDNI